MTITVKIGQAKTHLSDLLAKAEAGEDIVIARGDRPIARLVRIEPAETARAVIAEILASRSGNGKASDAEIHTWRDTGRR